MAAQVSEAFAEAVNSDERIRGGFLSCKLGLIKNDSRVEPAELKRVTQPALVFAVAVHLLRPMC